MNTLSIKNASRLCAFSLMVLAFAGPNANAASDFYEQHNLVANQSSAGADVTDANLVNPWGLAFNPFGPAWVANAGSGVSTVYDGDGTANALVVQIPSASAATGGHPTGIVFNGSTDFKISVNNTTEASRFIFATEEGVIAGWSPTVNQTQAVKVVDNSASNAVYKGLALSANGSGSLLYAADFRNNKVDVFDGTFKPVTLTSGGAFVDTTIPPGFAPFGIQAIGGNIYVAYAMQDNDKQDDVKGNGLGYVNVFTPNGVLIKRVVSQGRLNAPWGMALAPAGFGKFANHLLIGNFGDGTINAYDPVTGNFAGQLTSSNGSPIQIDGLWGLAFGNGYLNQPVNSLFFTAGPNNEQNGLYGRLDVQDSVSPNDCLFNWAETVFPDFFAPAGSPTQSTSVYTYRYYSSTRTYLAVSSADNHLYYVNPFGRLQDVGAVAGWLTQSGCRP